MKSLQFNKHFIFSLSLLITGLFFQNISEASVRKKRSAPISSEYFWNDGIDGHSGKVYYKFQYNDFSNKDQKKIEKQMRLFESIADIEFIKVNENYNGYSINIVNGKHCSSIVGKFYNWQKLSLNSSYCLSEGTIQHELLHALGFKHEHSRYDRDDHINVNFNNIDSTKCEKYNFDKGGEETTRFGDYDLSSIMHYESTACGKFKYNEKNGRRYQDTVIKIKDSNEIIQRGKEISPTDIEGLTKAYGAAKNKSITKALTASVTKPLTKTTIEATAKKTIKKRNLNSYSLLLYALDNPTQYKITYLGYNLRPIHSEIVDVDPKFINSGIYHPITINDFEWIVISAHEDANNISSEAKYFHVRKAMLAKVYFMTWENKFDKFRIR
ncbi:M12 family metallopeptidase [Fluviispira multicolorata]|uniref:Peptidase M12A domain-containing protein n=1 Tax=Fluviispira multicolorata TaxID=2654512 RepID=A0A833N4W6_9BACT|nr:M12 family metallopeptidase [Fluviispira multicolorata]KAB8029123.1 hypothetical protein GCL57_11330 [Fluviispira multicolorata]